jgi:5-methylcytosine-specific restriction endonuclease McrA
MSESTTKRCKICGVEYPLTNEYFAPIQRGKYFNSYCRECHSAINANNKRKIIARDPAGFSDKRKLQPGRSKERAHEQNTKRYRENRQAERERVRIKYKKYWERNRAKQGIYGANRRARMKNADGNFTLDDIRHIYDDQEHRCLYCGITVFDDEITVDHVIPITRGGSNWPDNLAVACQSCNSSKNNKLIPEWEKVRGW